MEYPNRHESPSRPGTKSRLPELVLDWEPVVMRGRGYAAAQHQIRAIYTAGQMAEIVDAIFSFASRSCLYNCALVCKSYHDIANKHLWRRLPSALPILSLLGDIQYEGPYENKWTFVTRPSQSSWENFQNFARYVKIIAGRPGSWSRGTLDYDYDDSAREDEYPEQLDRCYDRCQGACYMDRTTLNQIVQHQYPAGSASRTPLLPNLEHLEFTFSRFAGPPKAFLPLLGPRLKTVILLYHTCALWMPFPDDVLERQRAISRGVRELAEFEGDIPLERLELSIQTSGSFAMQCQEIDEAFLLALKRYTKLRRVKAPSFLLHEDLVSGLRDLRHLQYLSVAFEAPEALMSFLTLFAPRHPDIRHLELEYRRGNVDTPRSILDPLLHCSGLISLSITTYPERYPTGITNWPLPDVYAMSEAWPKLESLTLCPQGVIPLKDLGAFQDAELFPNLKSLTLGINSVGTALAPLPVLLSLRSLQSLQVFTIEILPHTTKEDISALIEYVARIGTPKTRIELRGHVVDCVCELCSLVSECHHEELQPLAITFKTIRSFSGSNF